MRKLTHGSLFSGIGGFDLAAEWMGWDNKFHCEWNEFGQKILHHYWPMAESFTDITKTDFKKYYGTVDIITGGFPCQPYSSAGKRKGKEDERHLWPEMLRAIREVSPRFVVGENVRGLTNWNGGMVFEEVCAELESYGYQVAPIIIPACAVGAPHRRERVWFVAYAESVRWDGGGSWNRQDLDKDKTGIYEYRSERSEMGPKSERHSQERDATDTSSVRFREYSTNQQLQSEAYRTPNGMDEEITTDADGRGIQSQQDIRQEISSQERINSNGSEWNVTNSERVGRLQSSKNIQSEQPNGIQPIGDGREWDATDTSDKGLQRGELIRTPERRKWKQNDSREPVTQLHKIENWQQFPTQSPVCGGNDGFSGELDGITFPKWRAESIKAYGNAIVPQVAFQIFKAIEKTLYL